MLASVVFFLICLLLPFKLLFNRLIATTHYVSSVFGEAKGLNHFVDFLFKSGSLGVRFLLGQLNFRRVLTGLLCSNG